MGARYNIIVALSGFCQLPPESLCPTSETDSAPGGSARRSTQPRGGTGDLKRTGATCAATRCDASPATRVRSEVKRRAGAEEELGLKCSWVASAGLSEGLSSVVLGAEPHTELEGAVGLS